MKSARKTESERSFYPKLFHNSVRVYDVNYDSNFDPNYLLVWQVFLCGVKQMGFFNIKNRIFYIMEFCTQGTK